MADRGKTHYEVLEIREDAELIDIKKAYRRLALRSVHCSRYGVSTTSTRIALSRRLVWGCRYLYAKWPRKGIAAFKIFMSSMSSSLLTFRPFSTLLNHLPGIIPIATMDPHHLLKNSKKSVRRTQSYLTGQLGEIMIYHWNIQQRRHLYQPVVLRNIKNLPEFVIHFNNSMISSATIPSSMRHSTIWMMPSLNDLGMHRIAPRSMMPMHHTNEDVLPNHPYFSVQWELQLQNKNNHHQRNQYHGHNGLWTNLGLNCR